MKKILTTLAIFLMMVNLSYAQVDNGTVLGTTDDDNITSENGDNGEVKGTTDENENDSSKEEKSFIEKYWVWLLLVLVLIAGGSYAVYKRNQDSK